MKSVPNVKGKASQMKPAMRTGAKNGGGYKGFAEGGSAVDDQPVGRRIGNAIRDAFTPRRELDARARTRRQQAVDRTTDAVERADRREVRNPAPTVDAVRNAPVNMDQNAVGGAGSESERNPSPTPARRAAPRPARREQSADDLNDISLKLARGENAGNSAAAANIAREMRGYGKGGPVANSRTKYSKR